MLHLKPISEKYSMVGLDLKGIVGALVIAGLIYYVTGKIEYILGFIVFLLISNYISLLNVVRKMKMNSFEMQRGIKNVISNALFPTLFAITNNNIGYLGSLASIMSDKFSSELGVFDNRVYTIIGFKRTIPGKSGGVSPYGTVAGIFGSMIIAIFGVFAFGISLETSLIITIAGMVGNLADSVAGYFEERGIGTKETSNLIGGAVGGIAAILLDILL